MSMRVKFIFILVSILLLVACESGVNSDNVVESDGKNYLLGGTVAGQVGEGLVLTMNEDQQVTVNRNGRFAFPKTVLSGTRYNIGVAQQPTDPPQKCRVTTPVTGQATMPTSNVETVRVVCEFEWSVPQSFDENLNPIVINSPPRSVDVAMNDEGDIVVVWLQEIEGYNRVFKAEYRDGLWSLPSDESDYFGIDGSNAFTPKVALIDSGYTAVTWYQIEPSEPNRSYLLRSEYISGTWKHPITLGDSFNIDVQADSPQLLDPQIALSTGGLGIIVWSQSNGNSTQIFKSERNNGVWTDPGEFTDALSIDDTAASSSRVAIGDNGDVVVVWLQSDGTGATSSTQQLFVSERRNKTWKHPRDLDDNVSFGSTRVHSPTVAVNSKGHTIIAWIQFDGNHDHLFKRQYRLVEKEDNTGDEWKWIEQTSIGDDDRVSILGAHSSNPKVAVNDNDQAILVWQYARGAGGSNIFSVTFRNGRWSAVDALDQSFTNHLTGLPGITSAYNVNVDVAGNGNYAITWLLAGESYQTAMKGVFTSVSGQFLVPPSIGETVSFGGELKIDAQSEKIPIAQIIEREDDEALYAELYNTIYNKEIQAEDYEKYLGLDILIDTDGNKYLRHDTYTFNYSQASSEAEVKMAKNGEGIIVWNQESDVGDDRLYFSHLRTQAQTPKYKISGVIAGLAGPGLVLRNISIDTNDDEAIPDTEDLTVDENGSFEFEGKLKEGFRYTVSVVQSPLAPLQICSVSNSTGIVAQDDISTITVTCENDLSMTSVIENLVLTQGEIIGATIDANNNLYIADKGNANIVQIQSGGTRTILIESIPFSGDSTHVMISDNKLYFVNNTDTAGSIYEVDLVESEFPVDFDTLSAFISSADLLNISGLAKDSGGSFYASVSSGLQTGSIVKISSEGEILNKEYQTVQGNWLSLAHDQEFVFVAETDKVSQIDATGQKYTVMAGLEEPVGLFFRNESIYFVDGNYVYRLTPYLRVVEKIFDVSELPEQGPVRVVVNSLGEIYLLLNNKVWQIVSS